MATAAFYSFFGTPCLFVLVCVRVGVSLCVLVDMGQGQVASELSLYFRGYLYILGTWNLTKIKLVRSRLFDLKNWCFGETLPSIICSVHTAPKWIICSAPNSSGHAINVKISNNLVFGLKKLDVHRRKLWLKCKNRIDIILCFC